MTSRFHIVIPDFINDDLAPEREILGDLAEVVALDAHDEREIVDQLSGADAVMLYHNLSLSAASIERMTRCRLIVRCGVGYDNIDHAFAGKQGIPVANVPDYGTEEVADSAMAMALSLARGVHTINSTLRSGIGPYSYTQITPIQRLRGRVFGIVGLGRIGTATALRAKAFGMHVMFFDPLLPDGVDKAVGCERCETLEALLEASHILSLHCPLTDRTRRMIDRPAMDRMPRGSYLINTARGDVVDTAALPAAIAEGQLAGAGIDVLAEEPPRADNPLVAAWRDANHPAHHRLILNPHSAFYSEQGLNDMRVKGANACRNALLDRPIRNVVNHPV